MGRGTVRSSDRDTFVVRIRDRDAQRFRSLIAGYNWNWLAVDRVTESSAQRHSFIGQRPAPTRLGQRWAPSSVAALSRSESEAASDDGGKLLQPRATTRT